MAQVYPCLWKIYGYHAVQKAGMEMLQAPYGLPGQLGYPLKFGEEEEQYCEFGLDAYHSADQRLGHLEPLDAPQFHVYLTSVLKEVLDPGWVIGEYDLAGRAMRAHASHEGLQEAEVQ
jgi:hypothetical protein